MELEWEELTEYRAAGPKEIDFRDRIHPKKPTLLRAEEYHQVFGDRHGFLEDLSILDLLFIKGPAAYAFLLQGELRDP
jgi:hypothetical protein